MCRSRILLLCVLFVLPVARASAQDCCAKGIESSTFDRFTQSLLVQFDNSGGRARFSYDFESRLILVQDTYCYFSAVPLIVNGNETVAIDDVRDATFVGGSGNDSIITNTLGNFGGQSGWVLRIFGGDGDDFLQGPEDIAGMGTTYLYGGNGNDRLYSEHGNNNYMFGEDGDDMLTAGAVAGGSDHYNYLDGGAGTNIYFSPNSNDTFVIHQGSGGIVFDLGGNDTYLFVADGTSGSGSINISELPNGGFDTLDFSQWAFPVAVDLSSTEPQVVSVDEKGNTILTLRLFYPGTIENLVLPGQP